jgi:hypothetical protein
MTAVNREQAIIFSQMVDKASELSVENLKAEIIKDSKSPALPNSVFDAMLQALSEKLTEEEFTTFCNSQIYL